MRNASQHGFTLIDLLIGTAIAVMLGALLVALAHAFSGWNALAANTVDAQATIDRLSDRWSASTAGAWAVFVPPDDVCGRANADGHEFDIATQDDLRRPSYRAYLYDAASRRVSEYTYGAPGAAPLAGDVSENVVAFDAHTQPLSTLQRAGDPFYDSLFAKSTIVDADVPVGMGPVALGGNRVTRVHIIVGRVERTVMLASGTAPSSFTVILTYTPPPA
ncbi:MAG TPA: hypothetical protein VIJ12_00670 [Candidatus Baltobacteraceae bacterium]